MNSNMYYRTPFFRRKHWEKKIVNELGCQLYKISGKQKFYASDEMLITVNPKVTTVIFYKETNEIKNEVKNTLFA